MKKRILSVMLTILYVAVSYCSVYAKADDGVDVLKNTVALMIDSDVCIVNGELKSVGDVAPTIVQSRTLVPARFLAESFGGSAAWDDSTKTATLNVDKTKIDVPIGKDYIVVNGKKKSLDVGGSIINSRTMLPLRGICEAMGKNVSYDDGMILVGEKDFNDRTSDAHSDITKELLRYQLTKGKVLKPASSEKITIKELAEKSECIIVDSGELPYEVPNGACYLSRGRMNIVNMRAKMKDSKTMAFDFDVYNQRCSYGIVEVYDEKGVFIRSQTINPYGGSMTTNLNTWFEQAKVDIPESFKAIYEYAGGNSSYVDYKTQAKVTHVNIEAPVNGYMLFTANPNHSALVEKKNIIYAVSKVISAVYSVSGAYGAVLDDGVDMLFEEALSSELEKFFVDNTECYMTVVDIVLNAFKNNEITAFGYKKCVEDIIKTIYNALANSDINVYNITQSAITTMANTTGYKLSLDLKEKLPLVGEAFSIMDAMANTFNLIYFVMDFDSAHYLPGTVFILQETPTIQSSNIIKYGEKIYTSGKELPGLTSISELTGQIIGNKFLIGNNKVYYSWVSDSKGNWDSKLFACDIGGNNKELLCERNDSSLSNFILSGDKIYFPDGKMCLNLKTGLSSDLTDLLKKNEIIFYAKGDNIYCYRKSGGDIEISKVNTVTGERELISTRESRIHKCFETKEGDIYFLEIEWLEGAWLYKVED